MGNIWVVSETPQVALQLLGGALELADVDNIYALAFSPENAAELANMGAARVYQLNMEDGRPESAVFSIADLVKKEGAEAIIFGATPRGRGIAASVAGLLDCGMASEAGSLERNGNAFTAERYIYGGNGMAQVAFDGMACVTVLPGVFSAPQNASATAGEIVQVNVPADSRVTLLESSEVSREGADISHAERIVCLGRGVEKQDDMKMLEELARLLKAEIACSRGIAEDLKWLPLDRYIGISGAKVHPDLHVSVGISGQVQHVAGIRDARIIVAVDNNENAPIFQAADYGIIGDLYEVIPALNRALGA